LSVGLSVTTVSREKAAEPIVMLFEMLTRIGRRNHVLDEVQIPTREVTILRAEMGPPGHARTCPEVDILKATRRGGGRTGTMPMPIWVY